MRRLLLILAIAVFPTIVVAQTTMTDLLAVWSDLNSFCRGWSGDDKHTDEVCETRNKMDAALKKLGYCYGKRGQAGYQMSWYKCASSSNR
jgi:hypothetical protein